MRKVWLDIEYMEKDERDGGKFNKYPVSIYLFKVNNKTLEKGVIYVIYVIRCDIFGIQTEPFN